jgi:predicted deacylase
MSRTEPNRPKSTAFMTVDLDKPGRQVGFVMIPHSPHDDAWGVTRVPIAVIANGKGPTVILEGGNHGDEYEGPITICELIRELDPGSIQGRLILMPANNVHAVIGGQRTSPVDGLNFNRTFPGDPRGTITQQISAFLTDEIFPHADAFLDLHSGGSSLDDALHNELSAFVDGIRSGRPPRDVTLRDACAGLAAADAILESLRTGAPVGVRSGAAVGGASSIAAGVTV